MQPNNLLHRYFAAELEAERCKIIPQITSQTNSDSRMFQEIWSILSMLPTRLERVCLVNSITLDKKPTPTWSVCSFLLKDSEQDIVGNAINAMTRHQVRGLAHRAFHYLKSPERPQRILYCLARYGEEAHDRRIAEHLSSTLASDLSDAYLARSFNALYKHGIKNEMALNVAQELISSHIDATNMDRKAAVAAITYLFFAGNSKRISELKTLYRKINLPELRRLLIWGFNAIASINPTGDERFEQLSAVQFWQDNLLGFEPNYTGYGCFKEGELVQGLVKLDKSSRLPSMEILTERILKLGDKSCIEWLARHEKFGLSTLKNENNRSEIAKRWAQLCPSEVNAFKIEVLDPTNASTWYSDSPELLPLHFRNEDLDSLAATTLPLWLNAAQQAANHDLSLHIYLGLILALENIEQTDQNKSTIERTIDAIVADLKNYVSSLNQSKLKETILSTLIGTPIRNKNIVLLCLNLMKDIGWADLAYAQLGFARDAHLKNLLQRFESIAKASTADTHDDEKLILLTRTTALSALNSGFVADEKLASEIINFSKMTEMIEPNSNVSSLLTEPTEESGESDEFGHGSNDWSGYHIIDKPISRWGAIIQSLIYAKSRSNNRKTAFDLSKVETLLREAMRTATHVEKRWISKALARLDTDEAVKILLYQGLQHIDAEFVSHVIRELLPSPHPRAQQALIRCVARNAISDDLKLNILEDIGTHNPKEILTELKTLEILRLPQHIDDAIRDSVGRIKAMMDENEATNATKVIKEVVRLDGQSVDTTIRNFLQNSDHLTVDARSALRTAEMILLQSRGWTQGGMDLSPIVNMHCKAVELVLRDSYEAYTDAMLRQGQLSRKLDILGYARPIPEKMQIFEDYLANLPVIKTIPYFSKFKLRKMLRGVCLFRPGKRFTLDGPKAFALFFLVTARKSCQFGLENMMDLGFKNDTELFEYIKLIHSLQDSRNRAVHEGLTWEAKDEIESMRAQAFKVIETSLNIKQFLSQKQLPPENQAKTRTIIGA